uniref:DUF1376 domain-containing protein n=1 Tax=Steinernema glaseri TaxID=37863 RepID=A0A1I7Z2Q2_9BILA
MSGINGTMFGKTALIQDQYYMPFRVVKNTRASKKLRPSALSLDSNDLNRAKDIIKRIWSSDVRKKNSVMLRGILKLWLSDSDVHELNLGTHIAIWKEQQKVYKNAADDVLKLLDLKVSVERKAPREGGLGPLRYIKKQEERTTEKPQQPAFDDLDDLSSVSSASSLSTLTSVSSVATSVATIQPQESAPVSEDARLRARAAELETLVKRQRKDRIAQQAIWLNRPKVFLNRHSARICRVL